MYFLHSEDNIEPFYSLTCKKFVAEMRTYVNKQYNNLLNIYFFNVFLSIPFNKLSLENYLGKQWTKLTGKGTLIQLWLTLFTVPWKIPSSFQREFYREYSSTRIDPATWIMVVLVGLLGMKSLMALMIKGEGVITKVIHQNHILTMIHNF